MNDSRTKALLMGGLVGAVLGVFGGLIYYNSNVKVDAEGGERLEPPNASAVLKLGLSALGLLRLIAE